MTVRYVYVTGGVSVDQFLVVHAPQTLIKGDFVSLYLFMFYVVKIFIQSKGAVLCYAYTIKIMLFTYCLLSLYARKEK